MIGDKSNLSRLNADFFLRVASQYGFVKYKKISALNKKLLEQKILDRLHSDSVMTSAIWSVVRDDVRKNPASYALILGISLNEKSE